MTRRLPPVGVRDGATHKAMRSAASLSSGELPPDLPGSCSDRRRVASAANAGFIFVLLQRVAHALGVGEGRAVTASYPEVRSGQS